MPGTPIKCPRCGYVDDGTSFTCPSCFAVLRPDLVPEEAGSKKVDPYREDRPGPVGRALGEAGRRLKGHGGHDTTPGAPAFRGPDGAPYPPPPGAGPQNPYLNAGGGAEHHRRPMGEPDPPTYLWQSIVATLFCCQPFGIVGIVFAAMSMSATGQGRWHDAKSHSEKARFWVMLAVLSGVVAQILLAIILLTGQARILGT